MPIISDNSLLINPRSMDFQLIDKIEYAKKFKVINNKWKGSLDTFERYIKNDIEYIFICVAKTASSSISVALNHKNPPEPEYNHMTIKELLSHFQNLNKDDYFKFAFVRNPWDRFISLYNDFKFNRQSPDIKNQTAYSGLVRKYDTIFHKTSNFNEFCRMFADSAWVEDPHFRRQRDSITLDGSNCLDFTGRFENLKQDWHHICKELHIGKVDLSHAVKSVVKKTDYRSCYSSHTKNLIGDIYLDDVNCYNYSF